MSDKTFQDLLEIDLSPVATAPYRLTSSDIPDQKSRLLSEVLRGTTIDNKWKTPSIDLLTSIRERKPTVAEDIVWATGSSIPKVLSDMVASGAVKLGTDPLGFALGAKSAAVGVSAGAMAGRSVAGLLGAGAGGLGAGLALPAIASEALSIKPAGDEEDEMGVPYYVNSIRRLDVKYANDEITDTEYNEQKSKLLEGLKKYKEEKNEIVSSIQGREYPDKDIVESLISWGGRTLKENEDWREWQKEQRGMSPDATADTIGSFLGYIAPLWAGSYIYGSGLRRPGYKTLYKGSRFRETVVQTPSPYTRQQIIDKLERFGKGYSFTTMSGDYISRDVLKYIDETGDVDLVNYKPSDIQSAMAGAYGAIGTITEYGLGGVEPLVVGSFKKVGLKLPTAKAVGKAFVQESGEEAFQELEDFLAQKIDNTNTRTWGEALKDMAVSAAWGGAFGASIGGYAFHTNRKNLIKGIMKFGNGKINQAQATMVADAMIESVENTMNYKNDALWNNLREKIAYMYEGSDVSSDNIDSMTNLEYTLIMQDSEWNGIKMEDNPIFKGEMTPFGWFREGIPEARRAEIQGYVKELTDLQDQLKKLNEAKEKDWNKIDEIETKIDKFNTYVLEKLSDLARADARQVAKILRDTEQKFVQREKERATKKAIKGGSVDVIADELSKAGFKTRDMSGTQIKELARLNWELLQGKDLGKAQSRGTIQKKLADIEANVESGDRVLERAGYTPEQIAKMDDETWNRAVLTQYRKEAQQITQPEYTESDLEGIEFQDEVFKVADENARLDEIYPEYKGETIVVDGKERTVYNSKGERINKSAEALTNFWRWFGDSKVVDEQGRPLVVYHGTKAQFEEFAGEKIGQSGTSEGVGFYFTNDENVAKGFGNVMSVYLNLKKPVYAYAQVFLAEDYDGDLDIMEANVEMIKDASMQVLEDLKAKGYEFYDETAQMMADIYTETDYDSLVNTIELYIKDGIKAEEYDGNKLYNDIREAIIKEFKFDGFKTKGYGSSNATVYVALTSNQIKSVDNRGTYSDKTGNIYLQNRVSGGAPSTYRGAYIPEYRFILKANKMDASTLSHELAHDWFETNFARYRSGEATPEFMRAWGALEQALGIQEGNKASIRKASEAFARAYEGWIMNKSDWARLINVDDKDKDAIVKLMEDYQNNLRDIYQDLTNPYFKETWGKLGELKPELVQWFDRATNITDLDTLVERGEITEAEANQEKLNRAIDKVIIDTADEETAETLKEVRTLNDTARYEVEGGNKNALQERLSALAREIDENNMLAKGNNYDTRRDMMQVAEAADNFVKTRLNDALAIINGEMAEVEGLYKEDIYTALERLAVENGDLGLLDELKNSEIANRLAKELGQRVAGFRNWKQSTDLDVVSALKSLDNRFNKALENKKAQKEFNSALDLLDESLSQQDKIADKELEATLKELECA